MGDAKSNMQDIPHTAMDSSGLLAATGAMTKNGLQTLASRPKYEKLAAAITKLDLFKDNNDNTRYILETNNNGSDQVHLLIGRQSEKRILIDMTVDVNQQRYVRNTVDSVPIDEFGLVNQAILDSQIDERKKNESRTNSMVVGANSYSAPTYSSDYMSSNEFAGLLPEDKAAIKVKLDKMKQDDNGLEPTIMTQQGPKGLLVLMAPHSSDQQTKDPFLIGFTDSYSSETGNTVHFDKPLIFRPKNSSSTTHDFAEQDNLNALDAEIKVRRSEHKIVKASDHEFESGQLSRPTVFALAKAAVPGLG